ncbi:MAG: thioredoxin family protein [Ignavibacteriae bacterium]|nr:thioredoxin family protein [Ignavibacteriota bacterium]
MPDTIEVFVEPGCTSCNKVIAMVTSFAKRQKLHLSIFDRERDTDVFLNRKVMVCPATYVNNRLVFYGEFTEEALSKHIRL